MTDEIPAVPHPPRRGLAISASITVAVLAIAGAIEHKWEPGRDANVGYWDVPGRVATACEGHTGGVVVGHRYSDAQCAEWKREDNLHAMAIINRCIHVVLTAQQGGALTDSVYNLGPHVVCGSFIQREINSGVPASTWCVQLKHWNHAGKAVLTGLTRRRFDDITACVK